MFLGGSFCGISDITLLSLLVQRAEGWSGGGEYCVVGVGPCVACLVWSRGACVVPAQTLCVHACLQSTGGDSKSERARESGRVRLRVSVRVKVFERVRESGDRESE